MIRRDFLKGLPVGIAGSSLLAGLSQVRRTLAGQAEAARTLQLESGFAALRTQYSLRPDVIYLNHGSIGTIPRPLQASRQRYLELCEENPWLYMWGGAWEGPREETREKAAALMGCDPAEVSINHNTTEGFNLLAAGLPLGKGDEVVFSSLNHPGASICWQHQAAQRGFSVKRFEFPVSETPRLTRDEILDLHDRQIGPRTRVLVFPHIDNMVGIRHPMKELAALARSKGVEFVAVDGAQSVGMIPLDVSASGVDFYASSPHKWLQAPKGLGLLFVRRQLQAGLRPFWVTWGQRRWKGTARVFEDYGTRNLAEVLVLGDAIDFQRKLGQEARLDRYRALRSHAFRRVKASPHLIWRSPTDWNLGGSLFSVEVKNKESWRVFATLNQKAGFVFRPFDQGDLRACRLSPNLFNTEDEIDRFVQLTATV